MIAAHLCGTGCRKTTWKEFLNVLFFIELSTWNVEIGGIAESPNSPLFSGVSEVFGTTCFPCTQVRSDPQEWMRSLVIKEPSDSTRSPRPPPSDASA
jgi:hypothetical protein